MSKENNRVKKELKKLNGYLSSSYKVVNKRYKENNSIYSFRHVKQKQFLKFTTITIKNCIFDTPLILLTLFIVLGLTLTFLATL